MIKINTGKADDKTNEFKIPPYLILLGLNFEKDILTKKHKLNGCPLRQYSFTKHWNKLAGGFNVNVTKIRK